ncbi:MAG: peroxiredoxin family protein [Akkermansiaceae bacterium]|nr:peroxiredoxin family protein [Armatimonadota bacterium]
MIPSPKTITIATFLALSACIAIPGCTNPEPLAPAQSAGVSAPVADSVAASEWVGRTVKSFTLPDSDGNTVSLADTLGKEPIVLIFYRGNWCPFCHAQMDEITAAKDKLAASGAGVFAISNEDATALKAMRDRHKLDFVTFLSDAKGEAAKQFGGTYPGEATLKPVTLVIGKNSKVVYAYTNEDYQKRATTQAVLDALARAR